MIVNFHSALFSVGALVGLAIFRYRTRQVRTAADAATDIFLIFLAGLLGARLIWAIWFGASDVFDYLAFWRVGLVSWGGLVAGGGVAWWRLKDNPNCQKIWCDLLVAVLVAWSIGRVGNYLVGDAYGVVVPGGRVPIQLLEAGLTLGLAIWLGRRPGRVNDLWRVALGYGLGRILIDNWRAMPDLIWIFNGSQLAALALVVCATIVLWRKQKP